MKYTISAQVTISTYTTVEAKSKAAALREARDRNMVSLCHRCASGYPDTEWVTYGELDGVPQKLVVEESDAP